MPRRKRLSTIQSREVDPISAFVWSRGDGLSHDLGEPCFETLVEAKRAWERVRRAMWAQWPRFMLPGPAECFDGLTLTSREHVFSHWNHVGRFDLAGTLECLAEDRANLARFLATKAARQISDYLAVLDADLDRIEKTARNLEAWPGDYWLRPYPHHLSTGQTYGAASESPRSDRGAIEP